MSNKDKVLVEEGFGCDEAEGAHEFLFFVGKGVGAAEFSTRERFLNLEQDVLFFAVFLFRHFGQPLQLAESFLHDLQVGDNDLGFNDVSVPTRVDAGVYVGYVLSLEAAHDMAYGVDCPDMTEEFVAESLAFMRVFDETGNINEFNRRRSNLLRFDQAGKVGEAPIGHGHDAHIRLYSAEGIRLGRDAESGKGIKDGRLARVWKSDYAAGKTHANPGYEQNRYRLQVTRQRCYRQ